MKYLTYRAVFGSLFVAIGIIAAACSGGGASLSFTPISGNSEFVLGPNRMALALVDKDNAPILGGADTAFQISYSFCSPAAAAGTTPAPCQPKVEQDATFVSTIKNADGTIENGFWVTYPDFDQAGLWEGVATLTRGGKKGDVTFNLTVFADSDTPLIGEQAPPDDNPTLKSDPNIKQISTDQSPITAFYQMTVTEAIAAHKPFVVIFATPAFCTSRMCGPALDNVKSVQPQFAEQVNFIHIEPYVLDAEGQLVPSAQGGPQSSPAFDAWHLSTEPWIFVVGGDGKVVSRFEGSASPEELTAAIQQALG